MENGMTTGNFFGDIITTIFSGILNAVSTLITEIILGLINPLLGTVGIVL